jgi:hypothetical protein
VRNFPNCADEVSEILPNILAPLVVQDFCLSMSFCVLCCPVEVKALRRADPIQGVLPNTELIYNFRSNSELKQVTRPNP